MDEGGRNSWLVIFICFLVAVFEGLDIQSMGVAAPGLVADFGLTPAEAGIAMSASTVGLMIGAALGGWLSDRHGRRFVLLLSMAALGIFSLATAFAPDFHSLVVIRVLAGLGLGGAFPNLIALTSEVAPPSYRVTALSIMYCGLPLGGAGAGALLGLVGGSDWHMVFYAGGIGPLLLLVPIFFGLPEARPVRSAGVTGETGSLFGDRRRITVLLWVAYFFTLLVVYLLLNWLPSLLVSQGYTKSEGAMAALLMNGFAVVGSLVLGRLVDAGRPVGVLIGCYSGMVVALALLVAGQGNMLLAGIAGAGFFVIGGQLVLYALGPMAYPPAIRGSGVGAAVAVGRGGSVAGPLLAGLLIGVGVPANLVPALAIPGLVAALVAALTALALIRSPRLDARI